MTKHGKFEGDVVCKWLTHPGDDRNMELIENFTFIDSNQKRWVAPKGSIVNGASIPSALWAAWGPPFVGDFRRASVIHDVACEHRLGNHSEVHLMFYDAMRTDGVGWIEANVMYHAVKRFGPMWSQGGAITNVPNQDGDGVSVYVASIAEAAKQLGESSSLEDVEQLATAISIEKSQTDLEKRTQRQIQNATKPSVTIIHQSGPKSSNAEHFAETRSKSRNIYKAPHASLGIARLCEFRENKIRCLDSYGETTNSKSKFAQSDIDFSQFIAQGRLDKQSRLLIVDQAKVLMEETYVHRPLKEAMYGVNPVQQLRLLREDILRTPITALPSVLEFHGRLTKIYHSIRDLHTNYFLPSPFANQTAFLPFLVEDYFEGDDPNSRRFLVTRLLQGFREPPFEIGVEVLRWNGVPIDRAVTINGDRFAGSNPEARRARGIETLTVRPLIQSLPPDEDFVLVEYRTNDQKTREIRVDWRLFSPDVASVPSLNELPVGTATAQGIDIEQTTVRLAKRILFAPQTIEKAASLAGRTTATKDQGLESLWPDILQAREATTSAGSFGYLRIRSFSVNDADRFVHEVLRLIKQLPQHGLIIDVRGNGGGLIMAGEQLLQLFTPTRIVPSLFQMRNTRLNMRIADANGFLAQWRTSMRQSVRTGSTYSQGFPITDPEKANELGQKYFGPVILVTDGLCYSTTDILAAGFQDHAIGPILGTDNNTGAGGANVWDHGLLNQLLQTDDSPFKSLPSNVNFRVSMRRTVRVGRSNGLVLEDLGVVPDNLHRMTRRDLLDGNAELLESAGAILAKLPTRKLNVSTTDSSRENVTLTTAGIDRIDFYVKQRPVGSIEVFDGTTNLNVELNGATSVEVRGFFENQLVASQKHQIA